MDWVKVRNRRLIEAIWREIVKPAGNASLMATDKEWKFYEGLLAATPAGEDDDSDLDDNS